MKKSLVRLVWCVVAFGMAASAQGLTILRTFDSSIANDPNGPAMMAAIDAAILDIQSNYTDNVTVTVLFTNDTSISLGQSLTWYNSYSYSTYLTALKNSATSVYDANAISRLPNSATDPVIGGTQIELTKALARRMGLTATTGPDGFDSTIGLKMSLMNFTRPPTDSSKYDLQQVVEHEIDEVLGCSSQLPNASLIRPIDLFRYTTNRVRTYTTNGDDAYFCVDGTNLLARFNMNAGGDYSDFWSYFSNNRWSPPGTTAHSQVQDAFNTPGVVLDYGINEVGMEDVIGWTVSDRGNAAENPPIVAFTYPSPNAVLSDSPVQVTTGTASDNVTTVGSVRVALGRNSDGAYYDFVSAGWGTTTFNLNRDVLIATGTSSWSAQLPGLPNGNYTVYAQSVDVFGHVSTWLSEGFTLAVAPPIVTFNPLTNTETVFDFSQLGGTINRAANVTFRIQQYDAGGPNDLYWNGTAFIASSVYLAATVTGGNWAPAGGVVLPTRGQTRYGPYFLRVAAVDAGGNASTNDILVTRSANDTTPPVVTLDNILNGAVFTNRVLPGLSGSALDNESGIASIQVNLYRFSGGSPVYWNGSIWSPSLANLSVTYNPQTVAWQVTSPLPSGVDLPNGGYGVEIYVLNGEAPALNRDLIVNFTVDYHPVYVFNYGSQFGSTPNMNWDSPDNWDVGSQPTPDARVVINGYSPSIPGALGVVPIYELDMSGGTLNMSGMDIQKLNFSGGQINGSALTLTNNGTNVWSGGIVNVRTLTVLGGSTLILTNDVNHDIPNCTLTNSGSVLWSGGSIHGGSSPGTLVYNYGLWDVQCDQAWTFNDYQGNGTVFNNYGTFRKSVGTNSSQSVFLNGVFLNQLGGVLDVQQGTFSLQGSANFLGGYVTTNNTGTLLLASGGYIVNGTVTSSNVVENGGSLVGTDVIRGALTWLGGVWNGANVTVTTNSTVYLASSASMDMANTIVTNNGRVLWSSGSIHGGSSPGTLIYNYGLWDVQCDQVWTFNDYQGNGTTFNNYGTLRKSVGTNSSQTVFPGGVYLNQLGGVVDVQQGTLGLQGGASFAGGYTTTNTAGTVLLAGGGYNLNGTITSSNVVENGGSLAGANVINGALTWLGGVWNNANVTVLSNSTVYLASSASMDMANTILTNNGRVLWSSGSIHGGSSPGTLVYNYGLWDVQCDQVWTFNDYQGNGTVFNNYATLRKSVGANGGQTVFPDHVFLNQLGGVLDVQQGTFSLQGGASFAGGYTTTNTTGTVLLAGGGYNFNGTVTSSNVVENGGNLVGANFIRGTLIWLGGLWNGAIVTVTTNSTVYLASSANMDMATTIVTNNGRVLWSSGSIHGGSSPGTLIYNYGLWDVQCDQVCTWNDYQGNGTVFNNYGTFRKSAGTNSSQTLFPSGVYFNQLSGVLDVQRGNFSLQGAANFVGGFVTTNNTGTTVLSGGSFTLVGGLTSSNVVENGGVPVGNNVIRGALTWLSGNWNGSAMTVASNSTFYMVGGGNLDVANAILTNNGTVLWINGYFQGGSSPGTFVYNNGLWDIQCDQVWNFNAYQANGTVFNNNGTLRKSAGTNTSQTLFTGGVYLNQLSGVLDVQRGNFSLQGGANFAGGFVTTNNTGTTILSGGGFTMSGGLTSSNVVENGGVPAGNNVIRGALTWLSGSWNGTTVTVSSNSAVYLAGGVSFDLADAKLTNNGTMFWSGGPIHGGGGIGTFVYNYGLWDVQCDQAWTFNDFQGNGTSFNNNGVVRKEGSVGTTTFTPGCNFTTPGIVDLRSGTLALNGAVYPSPASKLNLVISGPSAGTQFGSESFGFPIPFDGTLAVVLTNGYVPTNGQSFTIASYPSQTGQFSVLQLPPLPAVLKWQLAYNPTSLLLQVVPSTAFLSSALTNGNFKFTFAGQTGSSCLVEVSTNLSNWAPLFTNTPFNGTLDFVDPQTPQFRTRFYRATIFP